MQTTTRDRIVECADRLFYEQGFARASFADIAAAAGIARGNIHHHFRSKDDILDAVIARRMETTRAMLAAWTAEGATPLARIGCFVHILIANRATIMLHGCPVGTLTDELAKLDHAMLDRARAIFDLFRDWLTAQFRQMDCEGEAEALAMRTLGFSQGAATLAAAYRDENWLRREVAAHCAEIEAQAAAAANRRETKA